MPTDNRSEQEAARNLKNAQPAKGDPDAGGTSRRNLPKFSKRDWLGIAIGIAGTLAIFLIAGDCDDKHIKNEEQGDGGAQIDGGCGLAFLIAIGSFLINLAHVTGILLFESIGYQGRLEKLFSRLSIVGTPLALIAAALIVYV